MADVTAVQTDDHQVATHLWSTWPRRVGWALLVCWVLATVAAVFLGERSSTLSDLEDAVASGDVSVVEVEGGLGPTGRGYAEIELHWRDGLFAHRAVLREARPLRAAPMHADVPTVRAGVVDRMQATYPDLRVGQLSDSRSSFTGDFLGRRIPTALLAGGFALSLATLGLLIAGPQPWRATRWAWFWILGIAAPLGAIAYLVLAGPTGLTSPPRPGASRLTGGWAFLLSFLVAPLVTMAAVSMG